MNNAPVDPTRRRSERAVATKCALAALFVAAVPVAVGLQGAGGQPSIFVRMAEQEPMATAARAADGNFRFVDIGAHYDGVYFYAIARDPLARGEAHTLIDKSGYRYGHAGYGWLGWIFSFGNASAVPLVLLLLGFAGLGLAAAGTSLLSSHLGWTPWAGLVVAFHPGLIYSLTALTSETVGAGLLVFALLFWLRERYGLATITLVGLCLVKEPFVLVPIGLGIWEVRRWLETRDTNVTLRRLGLLAIGPVAFAAWYAYLRVQFGRWPFEETEGFFAFPLMGWLQSLREAASFATQDFYVSQIGAASGPLLAAAAALLVTGLVCASRLRSPLDGPYILLTLLALCLQPIGVLFPKDMIREIAMPLLLVPVILGTSWYRSRADASLERGSPG